MSEGQSPAWRGNHCQSGVSAALIKKSLDGLISQAGIEASPDSNPDNPSQPSTNTCTHGPDDHGGQTDSETM